MQYTSAEASKILRKLEDEIDGLLTMEAQSRQFLAAVGEDIESVRPEYDYEKVQERIDEIQEKVRTVKHAINFFNATHKVEGFDMTIDQMLIFIPQLSKKRSKLYAMKSVLPKSRAETPYGKTVNIIDYSYANYDIKKAEADYEAVSDLLARAQNALDLVNSTVSFEIDI